jgi:hypothetical protein
LDFDIANPRLIKEKIKREMKVVAENTERASKLLEPKAIADCIDINQLLFVACKENCSYFHVLETGQRVMLLLF